MAQWAWVQLIALRQYAEGALNQRFADVGTVVVEGTVVTDKDSGVGYTYRLLREDAEITPAG